MLQSSQKFIGLKVLFAASLISTVLGSIHGFSVFLAPLESLFDESRATISLTYSFALVSLTFSVLFGPKIYGLYSAATLIFLVGIAGASGVLVAGFSGSFLMVWLGYSLVFGLANGLGYGFGLQVAAQFNRDHKGIAMGVVTAFYALGAMVSPVLFQVGLDTGGFKAAMIGLAAALIIAGIVSGAIMFSVKANFQTKAKTTAGAAVSKKTQVYLWLGYFGSVLAGLMVIGHAAGISIVRDPSLKTWIAPLVIAGCSMLGSLVVGWLADKFAIKRLLTSLPVMTSAALVYLLLVDDMFGLLVGLGVIGFAYGGTIAAYPALIAQVSGMRESAVIYGRVFTAWGLAGLLGPWLAGLIFDWSGDYNFALGSAAMFALMPVIAVQLLSRSGIYDKTLAV